MSRYIVYSREKHGKLSLIIIVYERPSSESE